MEDYYVFELYGRDAYTNAAEDMMDTMLMAIGFLRFDFHEFRANLKES